MNKYRDERFAKAKTEFEALSVCTEFTPKDVEDVEIRSNAMRGFMKDLAQSPRTMYLVCTDVPNDFSAYMDLTKFIKNPIYTLKKNDVYRMTASTMISLAWTLWDLYNVKPATLFRQVTNVEVLQRIGDPAKAVEMEVR